jgi:hypothetical protein
MAKNSLLLITQFIMSSNTQALQLALNESRHSGRYALRLISQAYSYQNTAGVVLMADHLKQPQQTMTHSVPRFPDRLFACRSQQVFYATQMDGSLDEAHATTLGLTRYGNMGLTPKHRLAVEQRIRVGVDDYR